MIVCSAEQLLAVYVAAPSRLAGDEKPLLIQGGVRE